MSLVDVNKHASLVTKLRMLLDVSNEMAAESSDTLLTSFIRECSGWLDFASTHTDDEELQTLKREIGSRFFDRYNVRIEPKVLDNKRLTLAEEVIADFEALC